MKKNLFKKLITMTLSFVMAASMLSGVTFAATEYNIHNPETFDDGWVAANGNIFYSSIMSELIQNADENHGNVLRLYTKKGGWTKPATGSANGDANLDYVYERKAVVKSDSTYYSVSFDFKPVDIADAQYTLFAQCHDNNTQYHPIRIVGNKIMFNKRNEANAFNTGSYVERTLDATKWYTVDFIYDAEVNKHEIYLDGELVTAGTYYGSEGETGIFNYLYMQISNLNKNDMVGNSSTLYIDNFKITDGETPHPQLKATAKGNQKLVIESDVSFNTASFDPSDITVRSINSGRNISVAGAEVQGRFVYITLKEPIYHWDENVIVLPSTVKTIENVAFSNNDIYVSGGNTVNVNYFDSTVESNTVKHSAANNGSVSMEDTYALENGVYKFTAKNISTWNSYPENSFDIIGDAKGNSDKVTISYDVKLGQIGTHTFHTGVYDSDGKAMLAGFFNAANYFMIVKDGDNDGAYTTKLTNETGANLTYSSKGSAFLCINDTYAANEWFNVKYEYDRNKHTMTAYCNGILMGECAALTNSDGIATTNDVIGSLRFGLYTSHSNEYIEGKQNITNGNTLYVDNVSVTYDTAPAEVPSVENIKVYSNDAEYGAGSEKIPESANKIKINFSEAVVTSALTADNIKLVNAKGENVTLTAAPAAVDENKAAEIKFANLQGNNAYKLTVNNITTAADSALMRPYTAYLSIGPWGYNINELKITAADGADVAELTEDTVVYANADIVNNTFEQQECKIILCEYDGDLLSNVGFKKLTIPAGDTLNINSESTDNKIQLTLKPVIEGKPKNVKVFAWKSFNTLKPVAKDFDFSK